MSIFLKTVRAWLPMAFALTVVSALAYVAVQQSYRQSANDPQIQMAEDAANAVAAGVAPQSLVPSGTVAIETSLAPYLVFYGQDGTPILGNGLLNGALPKLPAGVFTYTANAGEDRITWQPAPGIREAAIVTRIGGASSTAGFVMAGRSLREVEHREDQLELTTDIAWIIALIGTFLLEAWVLMVK